MKNRILLLSLILTVTICSCKKEDTTTNNGNITLAITVKDSITGMPIGGATVSSWASASSPYSSFVSYVTKTTVTDKNGNAILKFETEDEKKWYSYFLNMGELSIRTGTYNYHYTDLKVSASTAYPKTIKILAYPKYVFDFVNVTGDNLDDSLIFTCSHNSSPQSGGGWYDMIRVNDKGTYFLTQPVIFYTADLLFTYYSIKYELKTYSGGTLLATGWLPYKEFGTETHLRVEF